MRAALAIGAALVGAVAAVAASAVAVCRSCPDAFDIDLAAPRIPGDANMVTAIHIAERMGLLVTSPARMVVIPPGGLA